jgi:hypothetical protein
MSLRYAPAVLLLCLGMGSSALAAPTPIPGGANQAKAVEGSLKATLFNGQVRMRKMALTKLDGSPEESFTETPAIKWLVFRAVMSNGTAKVLDWQQFSATLVDADGIAVAAQPDKVRPIGMVSNMPPGGAWKETILFNLPTAFKPVKIVLVPTNSKYSAFRISLDASDVPG